nr:DUF3265 domain-containing protein [Vibrio metschnikovii]
MKSFWSTSVKINITNTSRGTSNAQHFHYALISVVSVLC